MTNDISTDEAATPATPVFSAREIAQFLADNPSDALLPTDEQRRVIELVPTGSALVVAGAGSGKTQTLANRVVWLIANGFCAPEEILGLTFTVKAAGELNERIRTQLHTFTRHARLRIAELTLAQQQRLATLEDELAGGLNVPQVSTYNSFASGIVTEFGPYAGIGAGTTLLDQSAAEELALDIVLSSTDSRLLDLDISASSIAKDVLSFEHEASEHLVRSFTQVKHITGEFAGVADLPYNEKNPTTEKTYADIPRLIRKIAEKELIADLALEYRQAKTDRGFIEFSDQVAFAEQIATELAVARETFAARYRVILLDEVQDTSVGQTSLLSRLFQGAAVMGVGDPHQSIYAWRGAAADALDNFHQHFAAPGKLHDARNLTLSTSWRNPRVVLRAANHVSAPLRAIAAVEVPTLQPKDHADAGMLETKYFETSDEELNAVASWIKSQRNLREERSQPLPTVAVLVRNKNNMAAIAEALRARNIPSHVVGLGGLLSTPEITDLVSLLTCVDGSDANNELVRILTGPRFRLGVRDLAALADVSQWLRKRDISQRPLEAGDTVEDRILPDPDRSVTNIDALDVIRSMPDTHTALQHISTRGRATLREAGEMLHRLRRMATGKISDLIRAGEQELLLDIELAAHPSKHSVHGDSTSNDIGRVDPRANVDAFVSEVSRAEKLISNPSLKSVLSWIRRSAESDDFEAATPTPSRHTVQIMTIHKAKGLEWDLVALPGMREGKFPGKDQDSSGWFIRARLPDELRGDHTSRPKLQWRLCDTQKELLDRYREYKRERGEFHELEERRLAYVAITRAKQGLWMSGAFWENQQRAMPPSHYLTELGEIGIGGSIPDESQYRDKPGHESARTLEWPLPVLGHRERAVRAAAQSIEHALAEFSTGSDTIQGSLPNEIAVLLAEAARSRQLDDASRTQLGSRESNDEATGRINASSFHHMINDPVQAVKNAQRPIPQRPFRGTEVGNRFHEWVENRYTTVQGSSLTISDIDESLFDQDADVELVTSYDLDDIAPTEQLDAEDADQSGPLDTEAYIREPAPGSSFTQLQKNFEQSRWATRQPLAVELEITVPFAGQRLVCKLDAVFEHTTSDGTRIEIVDWKTGRAPRTPEEERDRFYQLDLYRHAYALWSGSDPSQIDAVLYYVAEDRELSMPMQHTLAELESKWRATQ